MEAFDAATFMDALLAHRCGIETQGRNADRWKVLLPPVWYHSLLYWASEQGFWGSSVHAPYMMVLGYRIVPCRDVAGSVFLPPCARLTTINGKLIVMDPDFAPTELTPEGVVSRAFVSPNGVSMQAYQGMPLTASVEEHLHNLRVYGESVYFMPAGFYGHGDEAAIPDTPLEEWNTGVDALLKECEGHDGTAL